MIIYEVISVCSCLDDMQMISENTYSSQIKLIGQSLCISEHGIGYLNLAFAPRNTCKAGISSTLYKCKVHYNLHFLDLQAIIL